MKASEFKPREADEAPATTEELTAIATDEAKPKLERDLARSNLLAAGEDVPAEIASVNDIDPYLELILELDREEADLRQQFERVKGRFELMLDGIEGRRRFFRERIRSYAEENRALLCTGGKKSRACLHGVVGWKKRPDKLVVVDEAKLLDAATVLDMVKVIEKPDIKALTEHFKAHGEIPAGAEWQPGGDEFYIKVGGETHKEEKKQ